MLKSLSIKNFKSYENATLKFAPLTLFVGPNASGKSNALEALRFMSELAHGTRLEDFERQFYDKESWFRGKVSDVFRREGENSEQRTPLEFSFSIAKDQEKSLELIFAIDRQGEDGIDRLQISSEVLKLCSEGGCVPLFTTGNESVGRDGRIKVRAHVTNEKEKWFYLTVGRPLFYTMSEMYASQSPETQDFEANFVRKTLQDVFFLEPRPSEMRGYSELSSKILYERGQNTSGILHRFLDNHDKKARLHEILGILGTLPEQQIVDLDFVKTERNDVMIRLCESFGGRNRYVDAPLLSDGTLRVLAVAAALLTVPEGSLLVIEEIDNGVHPGRAQELVSKIYEIATRRKLQVLVSSHNPALADAVPNECLQDVLCCYRNPETGASEIVRLGDHDRFDEITMRGTLGRLMTNRTLERLIKMGPRPDMSGEEAKKMLDRFFDHSEGQ